MKRGRGVEGGGAGEDGRGGGRTEETGMGVEVGGEVI